MDLLIHGSTHPRACTAGLEYLPASITGFSRSTHPWTYSSASPRGIATTRTLQASQISLHRPRLMPRRAEMAAAPIPSRRNFFPRAWSSRQRPGRLIRKPLPAGSG
ncbi:MAG: hypothetical protein ERJ67_10220 [Aphanocapsa feldmannii 277cV]|uniref:Uncharacterized protein n=1 Tax=Aphanocapsa feldmannii 277cV TaxID=2507553 RepID=A0A524RLS2_9CHRO|nr:MAG: hypothetical protein ERJ67_10220 [Aphanocapsa feldmannii 277cV]